MNRAASPAGGGRRGLIWLCVGLASSAAFMALALSRLHWSGVRGALAHAAPWPWLPLAVLCYLAGHVVRGARCRTLVAPEARLTLSVATNVVVLGYAVNNILPARLGEVARAAMLAERTGLPLAHTLTITFLERLLDGLVLLGLLALATTGLPPIAWVSRAVHLGLVVFGGATLVVVLTLGAPGVVFGLASRASQPLGRSVHARVTQLVHAITRGLAPLRDPRRLLRLVLLSVLVWTFEGGMFLLVLPAFGLPLSGATAYFALGVTNLGILVPSSPGFIGAFHYFCMKCLLVLGVAEPLAFAYAATVHLAFYLPITLWGVVVLVTWGVSVGDAVARARAARTLDWQAPVPSVRPEIVVEPSRFSVALCEALVPAAEDGLDLAEQRDVARHAAAHVERSTRLLPPRLAALLVVGLFGFRVISGARFLRGYASVPLTARKRWTEAWAYGRFALLRALFRAPRSLALVAYYEHHAVRALHGLEAARS